MIGFCNSFPAARVIEVVGVERDGEVVDVAIVGNRPATVRDMIDAEAEREADAAARLAEYDAAAVEMFDAAAGGFAQRKRLAKTTADKPAKPVRVSAMPATATAQAA